MDLNDITVFVRVAEKGSFTQAARALELPKSTVSERIARLEKELCVRLFDRTTRSLRLTESGADYLERVAPLLSELDHATGEVADAHLAPKGVLRVGAPLLVAQQFLAEMVAEFMVRYPDVVLEFVLQEQTFDLVEDNLDVAIHVFGPLDPSMVTRKLGSSERICVASPDYLAERGAPSSPEELASYACLVVGRSRKMTWTFFDATGARRDAHLSGRYAVTSVELVHRAALRGLGIAVLPTFLCADAIARGSLVRLLDTFEVEEAHIQVVYASGRQLTGRARAFADLLIERSAGVIANMPRLGVAIRAR